MKKKSYKIYEIAASLSTKEVRQIRKMLRSPFFGEREDRQRLFEILLKWRSKFDFAPSIPILFEKTFPKQAFEAIRIRALMSDLQEVVEEYLLISNRRKDKIQSRLKLTAIYRKREWEKNFQSSVKKSKDLIELNPRNNLKHYKNVLEFQEEKMNHQLSSNRAEDLFFQEISVTTDIIYLMQKLRTALSLLTHQSVYKTDYDFGLLKHLIDEIEDSNFMDIPGIALYYYCYKFLSQKKSLEYFQKFKHQLTTYRDSFNLEELKGPYLVGINFCIRKVNEGAFEYGQASFDLYKEGLAQGILLENGRISRFTFNNIVAAGLMLKELDWIENFIDTSADLLEPTFSHPTISFNKARLEFSKKNYGQALVHLQSAEQKDLVNNLIAKSLLLQIYFELKEFETLDSHLDSFRQFVRRREVSDYHRTNFINLISYVQKIMALPQYEKEERKKLAKKIKEESILTLRSWLLEKVEK